MSFQASQFSCDFLRVFSGPRAHIIGSDFAGQVESVGSAVKYFKAGDKIMGFGGAFGCGSQRLALSLA
jgi:NADPH:quinone reductase-like Zn-dependent oxidoreductase